MKYLFTVPLTISLAVFISACNQPSNSVPIQSDSDGYALAKQANKPRYSKPNASYSKPNNGYGKPVVVVNKHYYQTKPKVRVSRYKRK